MRRGLFLVGPMTECFVPVCSFRAVLFNRQ